MTVSLSDRDYRFAASMLGAPNAAGEDGRILSESESWLLSEINMQTQSQAAFVGSVSMRQQALVLISFIHAEVLADATCTKPFRDREAHVWMMAVLLYDKFLCKAASLTAWIALDPFREPQNPRLTKAQGKARLLPTSPHYWMLSVPAQDQVAAELHCNNIFMVACYSIAFKYETNDAILLFKNLQASLGRFAKQNGQKVFASRSGVLDSAELIFLDAVKWNVSVQGPLVHIDNLLWNAGITQEHSELQIKAYEHASHVLMDVKMLMSHEYSAFYAACVCVQQACEDLAIPSHIIFGGGGATASIAVVSECV